jgi:hypothetical protein
MEARRKKCHDPEEMKLLIAKLNQMERMTSNAEIDAFYELEVKQTRRRATKPSTNTYGTTHGVRTSSIETESTIERQRYSQSESKIDRERRPDGTVFEHEVSQTSTIEYESEIKRESHRALELFYERKIKEQHQWTQTLTTTEQWNQLCRSLKDKYSSQSKGVFQYSDEPLTDCLKKHEELLVTIVKSIQAEKPAVLTLTAKVDWLRKAYYLIGKWYPQTASAFFRCYGVFNGAQLVLQSDARDLEKYEKSKAAGTLPTVCVPFSRLSEPGVYTRKNPVCKDIPIAPPLPRTMMTETQLLSIKNAYALYCSTESVINPKGPMHSLLGEEQITKISEFVDDFLQGETSQFFNHIMSMQIAWRVVNGQPVGELRNVTLTPTNGVKNEYLEMQDRGAARVPFYRPDDIAVGWVRACVDYEDWGRYELILPDFVGIKLFGSAVQRWHKEYFCPAITVVMETQPSPTETSFIMIEGTAFPRSVLESAPEFKTLLQLEDRRLQDMCN